MAEPANSENQHNEETLLTLSEVSTRTKISMPTLQRYKKNYQDRIPSVGKGRKQRYPERALEVFEEIKKENVKKRGRPRKAAGEKASAKKKSSGKKAKKPQAGESDEELLTLTRVSELTDISYPTLVRYVKDHGERIPHVGEGRRRRYRPEAVEVFKQIRSESSRGRKGTSQAAGTASANGSLARRVKALEKSQERLEKQIEKLIKNLQKPMRVTIQRTGAE